LRRGAPPNNIDTDMAEFNIWEQETLAQFARDAQERMTQQDAEIEALRADLRTALTAYRALLTSTQPPSLSQNCESFQSPAGR
jgi:hypothetical protein